MAGGEGGVWGLVQCTPLSKATCAATHSRTNEEERKKNKWHLARQSILVLIIFIVQFPLLFWHYDTWQGTF